MADQPVSQGNSNQDNEHGNTQSGGNTQNKGGQSQSGRGGSGAMDPSKRRPDEMRDQSRGSDRMGTEQHSNAGSTGTSGGQTSPQPGQAARTGGSGSGKND